MTAPYKKRAKAGYNNDKSISNRSERVFEAKDIKEQFEETTKSGSLSKKKKKVNKELSHHISDLKHALQLSSGRGLKYLTEQQGNDWFTRHYNAIYQKARLAIPYLKEKINDATIDNKIKKQIKELLDQVSHEKI